MTWPRAILFDIDGTLAETEEWHREAFNRAFSAAGLDWHWGRELYRELLKVTGGIERLRHFAGATASEHDLVAIHAFKNACYGQRLQEGPMRLRPGVGELIDYARRQGIRLGVATTTGHANAAALIVRTLGVDALGWFEVMACAEDVAAKKPDPAVYHFALEALRVAPGDALAIEDSANGLAAAAGAGIACLVTPSDYCSVADGGQALLVLKDLEQFAPEQLLHVLRDGRR